MLLVFLVLERNRQPLMLYNMKMLLRENPVQYILTSLLVFAALAGNPACAAEEGEGKREALELTRDTTALDRKGDDRTVSYADILEPVTPAVVSVYTKRVIDNDPRREALEEMLRRYFGAPPREESSEPQNEEPVPSGLGSGFIVSENGYILTNNHVVRGMENTDPDEITVKLRDGREFEAELVGADRETDVALLKIDAENLPFLILGDSEKLRVGDIVFAIGNPLGIGLTVTQGIVSAKERTDLDILPGGYESFIQTDAAINRGNSGGPLVDGRGRVVGINSAILSNFAGGNIGLGFAIPVDLAAGIAEALAAGEEVRRGFIGIVPGPLDRNLANAFGLDSTKGAMVNRVTPGLPADAAGLRHGDVILTINGTQVDSVGDLIYLISSLKPESTAVLGIVRNGERENIDVVLGDRADLIDSALGNNTSRAPRSPLEGVTLRPATASLRAEYNLPDDVEGLVVTEVDGASPYARKLPPGAVLLEVNGQKPDSVKALREVLKGPDELNTLYVYFDGRYTYTTLQVSDE